MAPLPHPTGLAGFPHTTAPGDSRRGQIAVMDSRDPLRREVTPRRASQVPRRIFRHPPPPIIPEGPAAASARVFTAGTGFTKSGRLATFDFLTGPNRVRICCGWRLRLRHSKPRTPHSFTLLACDRSNRIDRPIPGRSDGCRMVKAAAARQSGSICRNERAARG